MKFTYEFDGDDDECGEDFELEPTYSEQKDGLAEVLADSFCPEGSNSIEIKDAFKSFLDNCDYVMDGLLEDFEDALKKHFEYYAEKAWREQKGAEAGQRGIENDYERMRG